MHRNKYLAYAYAFPIRKPFLIYYLGDSLCCRSLQRTLNELRDYQRKHAYWQDQKDRLDTEQVVPDTRFDQRVAWEQHRLRQSVVTMGKGVVTNYEEGVWGGGGWLQNGSRGQVKF